MELLNPDIIARIQRAEKEGDWNLVCMLLNKVQMSARSRYYQAQEIEIDEKLKEMSV